MKVSIKAQIYRKIKRQKRRGDVLAIAHKFRKSRVWVSNVCSAQFPELWDDDIIAAMLDRINKREEQFTKRFSKKVAA